MRADRDQAGVWAVTCPDCGAPMRQTRRGSTLRKRGPAWVCPQAEAERSRDEGGRIVVAPNARHPYLRSWQEWELAEPIA